MKTSVLAAAVLVVLAAGAVKAQDNDNWPCKADMEKFCKDAKAGNGGKMQCMKEHEKDLSKACKTRMEAGRREMMKKNPCMADMQKFCKGIKPGAGRLMDCMKQHEADFSGACKADMAAKRAEMTKKHPCIPDIEKFCKDVKPGEGRIVACLKQHETELSEGCKSLKDSDRMVAPLGGRGGHKTPPDAVRGGEVPGGGEGAPEGN